ncbi:hypothetical protein H0E87_023786, partial [Populus deltoides]
FHSASLRLVSRPALPSQWKPPMGVRFASNLIGKPMNFPMWCSSIGIQFTVIGFYHVPGFRLFRRPLLAQPTDVPWLRLRDAAPTLAPAPSTNVEHHQGYELLLSRLSAYRRRI